MPQHLRSLLCACSFNSKTRFISVYEKRFIADAFLTNVKNAKHIFDKLSSFVCLGR